MYEEENALLLSWVQKAFTTKGGVNPVNMQDIDDNMALHHYFKPNTSPGPLTLPFYHKSEFGEFSFGETHPQNKDSKFLCLYY